MTWSGKVCLFIWILSATICCGQEKPYPLWTVSCSGVPLYRGRLDSIVSPSAPAGHVHKVMGGNHFSAGVKGQSALDLYEVTRSASCTTCSISTVDNSNYWHPDLYYRWPNGTLSLVPDGILVVYYISRPGNNGSPQYTNNWQPFPKGLRMVAGDPFRRTFNESNVEHQAITFICLTDSGMPPIPETNGFPTDKYFCKNGLRLQVFFPMCWNNKTLDSPDHRSHMAYPTRCDIGDCPSTHPVRLPGVFFEAIYAVDKFPHGQGTQPFVLSNGDPTGYGFHGDFVNGWDTDIVKAALADPTCIAGSPSCLTLKPFTKKFNDDDCGLFKPIPLTENIGMVEPINRLPGCNPITYSNATVCTDGFDPKTMNNTGTFHIQSKLTGGYLTFDPYTKIVYANASTIDPSYRQVWGFGWAPNNLGRTVRNSEINNFFTMQDPLQIKGNDANTWEIFSFEQQPANDYIAIKNLRYGQYLKVEQDFTISGQATSITDASLFKLITPNGGYVPEGLKPNDFRNGSVNIV